MSLATATSSRQDRRKAQTAGSILAAAERLFLKRGYEATTLEQLADDADVAIGSIYGHFGGKGGLYAALIDRALELDKRYCDEGWARGGNAIERLIGLSEGYLSFARENPGYFRLFRFPPPDTPSDGPVAQAAERVGERVGSEVERMAAALGEAAAEGVLRPVEPEHAAIFLWAAWDGVISAQILPGHMNLTEDEFDAVLDLGREALVRGLLADSAAAR